MDAAAFRASGADVVERDLEEHPAGLDGLPTNDFIPECLELLGSALPAVPEPIEEAGNLVGSWKI